MIDEVPVRAAHVTDVRLQHKQATTWLQHLLYLDQRREEGGRIWQMFEEVAAEDDIDRFGRHLRRHQVARHNNLVASGRKDASRQVLDVHRDAPTALDKPQELAETGTKIEDHVVAPDVLLKKVPTQHLPNRRLRLTIGFREPGQVDAIETHRLIIGRSSRRIFEARDSGHDPRFEHVDRLRNRPHRVGSTLVHARAETATGDREGTNAVPR
jgi:hypothetical protein